MYKICISTYKCNNTCIRMYYELVFSTIMFNICRNFMLRMLLLKWVTLHGRVFGYLKDQQIMDRHTFRGNISLTLLRK